MFLRKLFPKCIKDSKSFKTIHRMQKRSESDIVKFDWAHTAVNDLPIDEKLVNEPRQVKGANYSLTYTTPVENPKIVSV